jgi:F-type H+-transporting ATPase subunit b
VLARRILITCVIAVAALVVSAAVPFASAQAQQPAPGGHVSPAAAQQPDPGAHGQEGVKEGAVAEGHTAEEEHEEGILPTIARLTNFAILVGVLVYFLRSPLVGYLVSRGQQIRSDLVTAAELRRSAETQLTDIDRKMKALPGELEALRQRGAADIAAEEARIRAAAEADRERLLEHMHRDVEMQVRLARRTLMQEAALLATEVARQRIRATMTPEDQNRLIDRYTRQLGAR